MKSIFKLFALAALVSGLVACGHSPTAPTPDPTPVPTVAAMVTVKSNGASLEGVAVTLSKGADVKESSVDGSGKARFEGLSEGSVYTVGAKNLPVGWKIADASLKTLTATANANVEIELAEADWWVKVTCLRQNGGDCIDLSGNGTLVYSPNHGGIKGITMEGEWHLKNYPLPLVPGFGYHLTKIEGKVLEGEEFTVPDIGFFATDRFAFLPPLYREPEKGKVEWTAKYPVFPCSNQGNADINKVTCRDTFSFYLDVLAPVSSPTGGVALGTTQTYGPFKVVVK